MAGLEKQIRLQVEAYGLLRFIAVVQNSESTIEQLANDLEQNILELYSFTAQVAWIKDQNQNDLNPKYRVCDLLKDMEQIYIFVRPMDSSKPENQKILPDSSKISS